MTTTKKNFMKNENSTITEDHLKEIIEDLELSKSISSQVKAVIKIGGDNKLSLLPFVCKIVSEQSRLYYSDCVEHMLSRIHLGHEDTIALYVRPDVKEYIDGISDWSDDIHISQEIDRKYRLEHPREKIAYLYYMARKGSLYGQLNAGSRMCRLNEDPEFLFHMPLMSSRVLRKGLSTLHSTDNLVTNHIRTSMQSLVVESHVKYILAMMEMGYGITDLMDSIDWLVKNYPDHQRWKKLISKTESLSQIFT